MHAEIIETLATAAGFAGAAVIVRTTDAIAEISGPLALRSGEQWLTLGEDSGPHVHLRCAQIEQLRFRSPPDANASLEVLGRDGALLCKLSFRGTNAGRPERFDAGAAAAVAARFAHLRG